MTGVKSCVISADILNLISTEYENVSFFTTFLGEVTLDRSDNSSSSNICFDRKGYISSITTEPNAIKLLTPVIYKCS